MDEEGNRISRTSGFYRESVTRREEVLTEGEFRVALLYSINQLATILEEIMRTIYDIDRNK